MGGGWWVIGETRVVGGHRATLHPPSFILQPSPEKVRERFYDTAESVLGEVHCSPAWTARPHDGTVVCNTHATDEVETVAKLELIGRPGHQLDFRENVV